MFEEGITRQENGLAKAASATCHVGLVQPAATFALWDRFPAAGFDVAMRDVARIEGLVTLMAYCTAVDGEVGDFRARA